MIQLRFLVLVRVRVGVPVFFLQQRPGLHDVLKGDMSLVVSRLLLLEYGLHAVKSFALRPAQVIASISTGLATPGAKAPSPLSALPAHSIISARARSLWRSDLAPAVVRCLAVFASSLFKGCDRVLCSIQDPALFSISAFQYFRFSPMCLSLLSPVSSVESWVPAF